MLIYKTTYNINKMDVVLMYIYNCFVVFLPGCGVHMGDCWITCCRQAT